MLYLELRHSPGKGRGVFACKDFEEGELIEEAPYIPLPVDDYDLVDGTLLSKYLFALDDYTGAMALGYGAMYNHDPDPAANYEVQTTSTRILIFANRPIKEGEEITINYIDGREGHVVFENDEWFHIVDDDLTED